MLERAVPLYGGLAILSAILFGPTGVDPRDLAVRMASSTPLRVVVWAAWLLMAAPVVGPLLRDRRSDFARALPIARGAQFGAFAIWALASQVPMVVLAGAGSGGLAAARVALLGAAGSVLLATSARTRFELIALGGTLLALFVDASGWAVVALAPAAIVASYRAWARAPEFPATSGGFVRGPAPVALAIAHTLRMVRMEQAAALRGLAWALAGGALAAIAARNAEWLAGPNAQAFVLAALAVPIVLACSAIAKPLCEGDRSIDVLLRASSATARTRGAALGGAAMVFGGAAGLLAFAGARLSAPIPVRLAFAAAVFGMVLAPWVVALQSLSSDDSRRRRDRGGRSLVAVVLLGASALVTAATIGELVVVVVGGAGLAAWLLRLSRHRTSVLAAPAPAAALFAHQISKRFGGKEVLRSASLSVAAGTIALVRGENGSGKSTLLKIAAGVLDTDEGDVWIDGVRLAPDRRALRRVGYAPDVSELPDHLSAGELIALVAAVKQANMASSRDDNQRLGIAALLGQRLTSLSLGQRRRVGLATALVGDPLLLLLDEPTNGLDAAGLEVLEALLLERRARGASTLLASHDPSFSERVADEVHWIRDGGISRRLLDPAP